MTDQEARYDRIAEGYAAWWSPVHRPATLRLLDEADSVGWSGTRVLDIGCGTGAMAASAAGRWPGARITGTDASDGMLQIARREAGGLSAGAHARITLVRAQADDLPFADASFDLVLSAFVLQLVPSRYRALREARRVLRPGGLLAYVTWIEGGSLGADLEYDAMLEAHGFEARDGSGHHDVPTPESAAAQLRRAGFSRVRSRADELVHQFTPEGYLGFVTRFDDEDLFATIEPDVRLAMEGDLLSRLRLLPTDGLELRLPIVYASGRRGAGT